MRGMSKNMDTLKWLYPNLWIHQNPVSTVRDTESAGVQKQSAPFLKVSLTRGTVQKKKNDTLFLYQNEI